MKNVILVSILFPFISCSQTAYDKIQDAKIKTAQSDITALQSTVKKLVADTALKGKRITKLESDMRVLKDSIIEYRVYLSSDLRVDKNKVVTIPQLTTLDARVKKLEAKP